MKITGDIKLNEDIQAHLYDFNYNDADDDFDGRNVEFFRFRFKRRKQ